MRFSTPARPGHRTRPPVPAGALAGALLLALSGAACAPSGDETDATSRETATALPDTVSITEPGLHPEGVEWDAARARFLVSSVTRGSVTAVRDDGTHRTFVRDTAIVSSIGIHVDTATGRLLVAASNLQAVQDTAWRGPVHLGVYDLETGERLHLAELATGETGRHFANDVTAGRDGSAYVTDSFQPVIYRVGPDGSVSAFVRDSLLGAQGFGLNGIDHHPDGFLVAAVAGRRTLVRVPLDGSGEVTEVELSEPFAADGIVFRSPRELVAVATTFAGEEPRSEVLLVRSEDGWRTARITGRVAAPSQPTTAAIRDSATYVVNPHFEGLMAEEPVEEFEIYRVSFP